MTQKIFHICTNLNALDNCYLLFSARAFLRKLETLNVDIGIDFFIIEEIGEGRLLVKGKGYLERPIWGAINDMVRSELGGRYDPSERGWIIEK